MSDRFYPIKLPHLLKWILEEKGKSNSILGVSKELIFNPKETDVFRMTRYNQLLETPIGVAAGPHTQMSQNIVLAWLMGARYIELKTIQTLDELEVSKPCIDMQDEGYNCEWSQELKLKQSFSEYLNAWIIIHILRYEFGWNNTNGLGTIFNMSAGYNLDGIKNKNVQQFLDMMENCQPQLNECLNEIETIYPKIKDIHISSQISNNLTLSTMHGCPPDEIESIGKYFIEERQYHTAIKLNPTLLGPDHLRDILTNHLGYNNITVPDEAFNHDLKFDDALQLIQRLQNAATKANIDFGLKLTNTLEVENHKNIFSSDEQMMYMSGRALHPISIHVAEKVQNVFDGELDISFSAGTDAFNIADILSSNIKPITVCTDLLKPGGYTRLAQYIHVVNNEFKKAESTSIDEFILSKNENGNSIKEASLNNLRRYCESVLINKAYLKDNNHFESIKTNRLLTTFDCVKAPCMESCATEQAIPEYMYQVAQKDFQKAWDTILMTNPMPAVTGHVCDHLCQTKCTRNNLDNTLLIRAIKRFVAENANKTPLKPKQSNEIKTAIIGAGPSGLTCSYYLALEGFDVDIFEAKPFAGGMVSDAIPSFRLEERSINNDIDLVKSVGVQLHFNVTIDKELFQKLQNDYDYIYIAAGAQNNKTLNIEGEDLPNVIEPLTFLSKVRQNKIDNIGQDIAVIGGGNTAMDAARTSKRFGANVTIIYRRTMNEMPADREEIIAALNEGIQLYELMIPESLRLSDESSVILTCSKMKLGEKDESGRARPIKITGSEVELEFDTIIPAVGQDIAFDFLSWNDLNGNENKKETNITNIYVGGDAIRGASSVINAVGDGRKAAESIINKAIGLKKEIKKSSLRYNKEYYQKKLAFRQFGLETEDLLKGSELNFVLIDRTLNIDEAVYEASRCLQCDDVCDICVSVCPNLANISYIAVHKKYPVYQIKRKNNQIVKHIIDTFVLKQEPQIINIGNFCNECGNCSTFCPTSGDPYKTKPKFYLDESSYSAESSGYLLNREKLLYKDETTNSELILNNDNYQYSDDQLDVTIDKTNMNVIDVNLKVDKMQDTKKCIQLIILYENLIDNPIFTDESL